MKPAPFAYYQPDSIEETTSLLAEHGDDAKILAGGQSLIPMMNLRLAQPAALIDISKVPGIANTEVNGEIRIGTMSRQANVLDSSQIRGAAPLIPEALKWVGHAANRNRGTFGGSIAHADAAAELPAVLLALNGEVVAKSESGERRIGADDFFKSYLTTALSSNELLCEVLIPIPGPDTIWGFTEFARRHGDFALAGVAFTAQLKNGTISASRIALLGVADRAIRAVNAENALNGQSIPDAATSRDIGSLVSTELDPPFDQHGSSEYRKDLAATLVSRVIDKACEERRNS